MLTREIALQRLRTGGRLSPVPRPANVIIAEQAVDPVARQIKRIVDQNARASGQRCLAPSMNHAVLP
jgi:hypothetical protein